MPISIFVTIWSYDVSMLRISIETLVSIIISVYILVISIMSPCPPFVNSVSNFGGFIIVVCWVMSSFLFMRVRCLIATKLERHGKHILLLIGFYTILGQVIGGILIYLAVDVYRLFKDKPACSEENFCISI